MRGRLGSAIYRQWDRYFYSTPPRRIYAIEILIDEAGEQHMHIKLRMILKEAREKHPCRLFHFKILLISA